MFYRHFPDCCNAYICVIFFQDVYRFIYDAVFIVTITKNAKLQNVIL